MNYTFVKPYGWEEEDKRIVEAVKNEESLPDASFLVICHNPGEWWEKEKKGGRAYYRHRYWHYNNMLHFGPMFTDEDGKVYETFVSHRYTGQPLTEKQKKQLDESFQSVIDHHTTNKVFHKLFWQPIRPPKYKQPDA